MFHQLLRLERSKTWCFANYVLHKTIAAWIMFFFSFPLGRHTNLAKQKVAGLREGQLDQDNALSLTLFKCSQCQCSQLYV